MAKIGFLVVFWQLMVLESFHCLFIVFSLFSLCGFFESHEKTTETPKKNHQLPELRRFETIAVNLTLKIIFYILSLKHQILEVFDAENRLNIAHQDVLFGPVDTIHMDPDHLCRYGVQTKFIVITRRSIG